MKWKLAVATLMVAGTSVASAQGMSRDDMDKMMSKDGMMSKGMSKSSPSAATTDGEVEKVDKAQGKITLRHGEIKNLGMPAMTMEFTAKDAAMLNKVNPGDKVRFAADQVDGVLTVVSIVKR